MQEYFSVRNSRSKSLTSIIRLGKFITNGPKLSTFAIVKGFRKFNDLRIRASRELNGNLLKIDALLRCKNSNMLNGKDVLQYLVGYHLLALLRFSDPYVLN